MNWYTGTNFNIELDEIGDTWQLEGIVIGDGSDSLLVELPWELSQPKPAVMEVFDPTTNEWEAWLKQSDNPVEKLYDADGNVKAIMRKAERQVDQRIVWEVYKRDNYTCRYCGQDGVPMTYDHYHPQTLGGQTTVDNGRTSCRRCNKIKGHLTIEQWKALAKRKNLNAAENPTP